LVFMPEAKELYLYVNINDYIRIIFQIKNCNLITVSLKI
jgi:hypothetical protein